MSTLDLETDEREMQEMHGQTSIFGTIELMVQDESDDEVEDFADDSSDEFFDSPEEDDWDDEDEDDDSEDFVEVDDEDEWEEEGIAIEDSYDRR